MGERFCVIERHGALKKREMRGRCGEQNGEKEGGGEREPRQSGAPTDTHFCLSSFPLRAGSRQVTAGLHFWQTRGSSSPTKPCTTPPWLPAAVIKPRQPEPSNKKANTLSIDSGQLSRGGVERLTFCRRLRPGMEGYYWDAKLQRLVSSQKIPHSRWQFSRIVGAGMTLLFAPNEKLCPMHSVWYSNHKIQMRFSILSINSHPLQCLHVSSLPNQHFHS